MDEKNIKSKPKIVRAADNTPKIMPKTKDAVITGADTLKQTFIKSKAELPIYTDEQSEASEQYATDTVEEKVMGAANTAADTVNRAAHRTIHNVKQRTKTRNAESKPDMDIDEPFKGEHNNQPKTRELMKDKKSEPMQQDTARARQQTSVKSREAATDTKELQSEPMRIKTKEEYIKSKSDGRQVQHMKSDKVYHSKTHDMQPKTKQTVREKRDISENRQRAAKKYVQNKLKTRVEQARTAEVQHGLEGSQFTEIQQTTFADANADLRISNSEPNINRSKPIHTKQKPEEKLKLKNTEIKTKDSYIRTHTRPAVTNENSALVKSKVVSPEKPIVKKKTESVKNTIKTKSTAKNAAKKTRAMKTSQRTVGKAAKKATVKTQKQAARQAAKQAAKRAKDVAQRSAQAAKAAAKAAIHIAKVVIEAAVAAAKALVSAIAAGGAVAVVIVILIVLIIVAAIIASPFGIFISDEVTEAGTIPLSQIIAEYNVELTQRAEDIELSVDHTSVEVIDNRTDTNIVLAVFAAKTAGADDDTAEDVVVFDAAKAERLKEYFRAANTISYSVFEVADEDGNITQRDLTITITGKTKDQLMNDYSLTAKQREAVETLLEETDAITASSHSLAVTDANVQAIIAGLLDSLPQKRKDVVKNAASLVGKVNYFWGGKSSAIGWDSAWGTMQRVTAAGSPSSGTIRAFGLDCSGFVTWAFNNSGMGYSVGHGTMGQKAVSTVVTSSSVQAGDLAFLPSYSHVGIVVGKDTSGNILVIHCSSSANNVVLSTASSVGFTVFRRPNCY